MMEKIGQISELAIKIVYGILAFIMSVFIVKNIILMFPLLGSMKLDENSLVQLISTTRIGPIYESIEAYHDVDNKLVSSVIVSFLSNIEWIAIVFLIITILMLFTLFMFIKWKLIASYLKLSGLIAACYLFKYILFGICFLIFFNDSFEGVTRSFLVGTIIYIIVSLFELFLCSLFIIKLVLNFSSDVKAIYEN